MQVMHYLHYLHYSVTHTRACNMGCARLVALLALLSLLARLYARDTAAFTALLALAAYCISMRYLHCSRRDTALLCFHYLRCSRRDTAFLRLLRYFLYLLCLHCSGRGTAALSHYYYICVLLHYRVVVLTALLPCIMCTCSRRDTAAVSHVQYGSVHSMFTQLSCSNAVGSVAHCITYFTYFTGTALGAAQLPCHITIIYVSYCITCTCSRRDSAAVSHLQHGAGQAEGTMTTRMLYTLCGCV